MKTYEVPFKAIVYITVTVEADTPEEALELAYDEGVDLECFCGNGGCEQLVGVYSTDILLSPDISEEDGEPIEVFTEP